MSEPRSDLGPLPRQMYQFCYNSDLSAITTSSTRHLGPSTADATSGTFPRWPLPGARPAAQVRVYVAAASWSGPWYFDLKLTKNGTAVATMLSILSGASGRHTSDSFGVPDSLGLTADDDIGIQLVGSGGEIAATLRISGCLFTAWG